LIKAIKNIDIHFNKKEQKNLSTLFILCGKKTIGDARKFSDAR
jgi:hypothetical protein